ncbi:MAG: leucine-rich repeat protein [Firmicutes bacterium]|nr:leucine-rich repeat protein [Bacillota bacterium]MBQ2456520.1 leucine-rich repeat protein [Bacillota bacterium]MBQ4233824.1 leucine-rich repeat protein [Bacillota bacterium]MBQ5437542.1 leucine-rich repeat protein [Bacillota bacterium]
MKNRTKLLLSLVLTLVLILGLPLTAHAEDQSGKCGDDLNWTLHSDTGVLHITGSGEMTSAPWPKSSLKQVSLPEGLTSIYSGAFYESRDLTYVYIPKTVTKIGARAFSGCWGLEEADLKDARIEIIEDGAFADCRKIAEITIPDTVKSIGELAFNNCWEIKSLVIPDSVESLGQEAFASCKGLEELTVGSGLKTLTSHAFRLCSSLKNVTIKSGVTEIGDEVFFQCSDLKNITIPASVKKVGENVFHECLGFNIDVEDLSSWFDLEIKGGGLSSYSLSVNGEPLKVLTLPEGSESVENNAFANCGGFEKVIIPDGVTSIGSSAFSNCGELKEVVIPSSVKTIGKDAFYGCASLAELDLPEGVESIGESAFEDCEDLASVSFPASLKSVGSRAFFNDPSLMEVTLPEGLTEIGSHAFGFMPGYDPKTFAEIEEALEGFRVTGVTGSQADLYALKNGLAFFDPAAAADRTELEEAVSAAEALKEEDYSEESFARLKEALDAAKALPEDADQEAVDAAAKAVSDAAVALEKLPETPEVDKKELDKAVEEAEALKEEDYTEESFARLKEALDAAKALPEDADQEAVAAAARAVDEAVKALEADSPAAQNKKDLAKAIEEAEKLEKDKYTEDTTAVLDLVLSGAKTALSSDDPAEIDKALQALTKFLDGLEEKSPIPFTDVAKEEYFYDAVVWAFTAEPQITDGTSPTTFSPGSTCTRAQVVTFLWRSQGCPEPETKVNPFADVAESDWFYKPVLWAVEKGITDGTGPTTFSPKSTCRNSHILTFIYRAVGEPEKTGQGSWWADAFNWANFGGLLKGSYTGTYDVNADCPRANVVYYLHRMNK